jgi:hypothetical protein
MYLVECLLEAHNLKNKPMSHVKKEHGGTKIGENNNMGSYPRKEKEMVKFKDQDTTIFPNKIRKEDKIASIFGQRS